MELTDYQRGMIDALSSLIEILISEMDEPMKMEVFKKLNPSYSNWKPSAQQMTFLEDAIYSCEVWKRDKAKGYLQSLYDDLKKL